MTPLLAVRELVAGYERGMPIVRGASLTVTAGEILVILGPNGAGKSTLVKAIAGLVPVESGQVRLGDTDITGTPAHLLVRRGVGFVPQTENVFPLMSVADNLLVASAILPKRVARQRMTAMYAQFPDLGRQRRLNAGRLSGGQRQMLAIARALITGPRLLLLDEPSAGLSPKLVGEVFTSLQAIRADGVTIVLVEQNTRAALAIGDRAVVLAEGRNRHDGPVAALRNDPVMAELFLGARSV